MDYVAGSLVLLAALLVLVIYRQQHSHLQQLGTFVDRARAERELILYRAREERDLILGRTMQERASLLDRVQHPEYHQVALPALPSEPPRDAAEMAYVGTEVPEFVKVGADPMDYIGTEVPEGVTLDG